MLEIIVLILITISAFIATNLDDLFLLMAFFSFPEFQDKGVVFGQFMGMGTLIIISSSAYFFQMIIPTLGVALLGVLPILIGLKHLMKIKKTSKNRYLSKKYIKRSNLKMEKHKVIKVALTTIANGGDNIGIYAPLFMILEWEQICLVSTLFLVLTGIWCLTSFYMVNNNIFGDKIRSYGYFIFPLVLIAIGIAIIIKGILGNSG